MNDIKKFVAQWSGQGYENGETQPFWLSFIRDVLGVSEPEKIIRFGFKYKNSWHAKKTETVFNITLVTINHKIIGCVVENR